jgi:hypothetical protein
MADIEMVIKIPEELISEIDDENYQSVISWYDTSLYCAIQEGTPLPKGHGDLKDATDLLKMTESYKSELGRLKADPFVKSGIETVESFIKEMQTIIEAESEVEE